MDFDKDQIAGSPFTIGALGALITAFKSIPGVSWFEKIVNVAAGSMCAGFLSPALTEWLHLTSSKRYGDGAAFLVGMLGMSVIVAIQQSIRDIKFADIFTGWFSRRG